jgi:hypothetical protein
LQLSDLEVDLNDYISEAIFPTQQILDFKNARNQDPYARWVKPEEKHGFNGKVNGQFVM